MIVTIKTNGCIGVPIVGTTVMINLVPGVQDISDALYAQAYGTAKRLVAGGQITEEWVKEDAVNIKKDDYPSELVQDCPDAKDKDRKMIPAKTMNIDRRSGDKLSQLIKGCFHLPTLEKWEKEELRADIRLEILQQRTSLEEDKIKG